nr:MAG TPA: hypothetical protein [Caudoviricetes sp.]
MNINKLRLHLMQPKNESCHPDKNKVKRLII